MSEIRIGFSGEIDVVDSNELKMLHEQLSDAKFSTFETTLNVPGMKNGGLTVAIAVGGLVVSTISALVSALSIWLSSRSKYTATIDIGKTKYTISTLSKREMLDLASTIGEENIPANITISKHLNA